MQKNPGTLIHQRYRLTLEYAGSGYSGWQKQTDARTIQGTLLSAAAQIFGEQGLDIQGHGRTDAGVHALNYTAHLETTADSIPPTEILDRFNDLLPSSIVMLSVAPCDPRFHARHNCIGRSYLYQLSRRKTAFHKKYVWWPKSKLDSYAMAEAAKVFTGMHDFASFAEKQELKKSTKVLVNGVFVYDEHLSDKDNEMIRIRVVGSHFLWRMVRRMVGVLVEVGKGNLTSDDVAGFLNGPTETPCQFTAPSSGLFFEQAFYDKNEFNRFLAVSEGATGQPPGIVPMSGKR